MLLVFLHDGGERFRVVVGVALSGGRGGARAVMKTVGVSSSRMVRSIVEGDEEVEAEEET